MLVLALSALVGTPAAAGAEVQPVAAVAAQPKPVAVTVDRSGTGFVAEFRFPRSAPAWGFFRSSPASADGESWRLKSWRVLTPGVELQRRGKFDALVGTKGRPVPRTVRVAVTPFTGEVQSEYVPALKLGGDSVALFDDHFAAFSIDRADKLDTLPVTFDRSLVTDGGTSVRFRGGGLRLAGDIDGYREGHSEGTYGLYGVPEASVRSGIATVVDSELPQWIADDLISYSPKVFETLTAGLGPSGITQPTILAAWEGADREGASMNGGALKGLLLMRFEGKSAVEKLPALADLAHWFIAHETSHFWLGQAVHYTTQRDSWILEGGADLLAVRTVQKLSPEFDPKKKLNKLLAECAGLADDPVASAIERNEHRAYYACGAMFALVAEKASGGDFYDFTRKLVDSNRADGEVTAQDWFDALDRASGSTVQSAAIRTLVEQGSPDPKGALADLLAKAGIAYALNGDGVPQLQ